MKKLVDANLAKINDLLTINNGISSLDLMEKAGLSIASYIIRNFRKGKVLVVCGSSGNGGDGLVVARTLYENNYEVDVLIANKQLSIEAQTNLNKYKGPIVNEIINRYDYIIDALIGFGLEQELSASYLKIVNQINLLSGIKMSIDIPTGLNATNGKMMPTCIKADYTFVIQNYKIGHFYNYGLDMCGNKILFDIGILNNKQNYVLLIEKADLKLPNRYHFSNKGDYGTVSILGGCYNYTGAPILSLKAALRMGAGYVRLCVIDELYKEYLDIEPSSLKISFPSVNGHFDFSKRHLDELINTSDSIAIGMGCGVSLEIYEIIKYLLKNYDKKLLIDADGLNCLAKYGIDILKNKKCEVILTPHMKEFSRLTNKNLTEISSNPINYLLEFSNEYDVCVLLKNNVSLCAYKQNVFLNSYGNSGLAKAGSGDVLSGIIASLLAYNTEDILNCGIYGSVIMGLTCQNIKKSFNEYSMLPTDIIDNLIKTINDLAKEDR